MSDKFSRILRSIRKGPRYEECAESSHEVKRRILDSIGGQHGGVSEDSPRRRAPML